MIMEIVIVKVMSELQISAVKVVREAVVVRRGSVVHVWLHIRRGWRRGHAYIFHIIPALHTMRLIVYQLWVIVTIRMVRSGTVARSRVLWWG